MQYEGLGLSPKQINAINKGKVKLVKLTDQKVFRKCEDFSRKYTIARRQDKGGDYTSRSLADIYNNCLLGKTGEYLTNAYMNQESELKAWEDIDTDVSNGKNGNWKHQKPDLVIRGHQAGVKTTRDNSNNKPYPVLVYSHLFHETPEIICYVPKNAISWKKINGFWIISEIKFVFILGYATKEILEKYKSPDKVLKPAGHKGYEGFDAWQQLIQIDLFPSIL